MKDKIKYFLSTPGQIYSNPATEFVWDFIGRSNRVSIDRKERYIRPERVKPDPDGKISVRIAKVELLGPTILYSLENMGGKLSMLRLNDREERFEVDDIIKVRIE